MSIAPAEMSPLMSMLEGLELGTRGFFEYCRSLMQNGSISIEHYPDHTHGNFHAHPRQWQLSPISNWACSTLPVIPSCNAHER